jgi:hypothetical protein
MARFDISQYTTVAERVDLFWAKYSQGRIHTVLEHFSPERVVIRAEIYLDRDDPRPVTVDFAEERPETSPVNKVSMVENCATSAIGRALADLGAEFTGSKRPSAEEMQKVQRHSENSVTRDWLAEAEKLTDVDALRLLWAEANQGGATPDVLQKVRERAETIGADGVVDGVAGGVPARAKKPRTG